MRQQVGLGYHFVDSHPVEQVIHPFLNRFGSIFVERKGIVGARAKAKSGNQKGNGLRFHRYQIEKLLPPRNSLSSEVDGISLSGTAVK